MAPGLVKLPKHVQVKAIKPGGYYNLILTTAGHVLAFGFDGDGELGDGHTANSDLPVQVRLPAGMLATAVYAGSSAFQSFAMVRRG